MFHRCLFILPLSSVMLAPLGVRGQGAELPAYTPTSQVSGLVRVCGSPQMGPLLELYEHSFAERQPAVRFDNNLRSTLTAVSGVYTGQADLGLLGREMWTTERDAFAAATGRSPMLIPIATGAFDVPKATFALMIFVSKENPLSSLTIAQLARTFSNTSNKPVRIWGDLGVKGPWSRRPIHLYGFAEQNDKALIFSKLVFQARDHWNSGLHEFTNDDGNGMDAGEKITRAVAADPDGIGISNVHYANDSIKALPVAASDGDPAVAPTRATIADHTYPLFRSVYAVVDYPSGEPVPPQVLEFLRFILSREGAQAVLKEGNYLPLSSSGSDTAARKLLER